MSEAPTSDAAPPPPPSEAEKLRRQAEALRQDRPPSPAGGVIYPAWKKFVILAVMGVTLAASAILALSDSLRRGLLARLGAEWTRVYLSDRQAGIHQLPAPPPRRVQTRVIGAAPVIIQAGEEQGFVGEQPAVGESERPFVPPAKNPQFEAAFRLLQARSPAALALIAGEIEGREFAEWRPLQARPPAYYVDLVVNNPDGGEDHYVWSVNLEEETVSAQSQLARDLEAGR